MKNLKFILFLVSQILSFPLMAQTVSKVQAEQVGKQIVITYSLDKQANISVCYTTDGGKTFSAPLKQESVWKYFSHSWTTNLWCVAIMLNNK